MNYKIKHRHFVEHATEVVNVVTTIGGMAI